MLNLYARAIRRPSGYFLVVNASNVIYAPTTTVRASTGTTYVVPQIVKNSAGSSFTPR